MKKRSLTLLTIISIGISPCMSQPNIITTCAGNNVSGFSGDGGPATAAKLYAPTSVIVDNTGNIIFCDEANYRIRKINTSGIITTIAGTGIYGFSGDGGQATAAQFFNPEAIVSDGAGNLFIADRDNNRIRKINTSGIISTIAGNGTAGFSGDGGPATAAELYSPIGVATDTAGNVFIADGKNAIRKVSSAGIITTVAGMGGVFGFSGDGGPATAAKITVPGSVSVDAAGNIYFTDIFNNRVRKVDASGVISTVVGTGVAGYSGNGVPATAATLNLPSRVVADSSGNLLIADDHNNVVRFVNTSGIIYTIAGDTVAGYTGDGGQATAAELTYPTGVAVDAAHNLYIADQNNNVLRKVGNIAALIIPETGVANRYITLFPNPNKGVFTVNGSINTNENLFLEITNIFGKSFYRKNVISDEGSMNTQVQLDNDLPNGIYLLNIKGAGENEVIKFEIEK